VAFAAQHRRVDFYVARTHNAGHMSGIVPTPHSSNPMSSLMRREVSRQEFIAIIGLVALSILGFGTIVKVLTGKSLEGHHSPHDYSGTVYGGGKDE
jgi:hypothetical protein